jgi:uncharacterized protein
MPIAIRTLDHAEALALLSAHHVGRLAYAWKQRVDIEPLHFVHEGDWLYVRTSPGSKLTMLAHQPWVALEVDDVRGLHEWESVVVHGTVQQLDPDEGGEARTRWEHGVQVFRRLVPEAFGVGDPTPNRTVMLRIHIAQIDGRSASFPAA